mmetsp:Transcript_3790/g.10975  ORF Transcript_3790/g.10975 Transcript_3790/m.10975 type:complete len:204 (-) Transcript_3790:2098-2709(-)
MSASSSSSSTSGLLSATASLSSSCLAAASASGSSMSSNSSCELLTFLSADSMNFTKSSAVNLPSRSASSSANNCAEVSPFAAWWARTIFNTALWNFSASLENLAFADSRKRLERPVAFTSRASNSFKRFVKAVTSFANAADNDESVFKSLLMDSMMPAIASTAVLPSAIMPSVRSAIFSITDAGVVLTLPTSLKIWRSTLIAA